MRLLSSSCTCVRSVYDLLLVSPLLVVKDEEQCIDVELFEHGSIVGQSWKG